MVQGLGAFVGLFVNPSSAILVSVTVVLLAVWRVVAMTEAMTGLSRPGTPERRRGTVALVILAVVVAGSHGWVAAATWSMYEAGRDIFVGETVVPQATASTGPNSGVVIGGQDVQPQPFSTPETPTSRVNVLVVGIDSSESRQTALTDTLLVVSVDPHDGSIAMVSFPRDIADFELPDGRTFRGKINSLLTWARNHPEEFPEGPLPTLAGALSHLLGVPIQYYAAIDLDGFRQMVDSVGGVTIDNQTVINDPTYGWADGRMGFRLSVGEHRLDGEQALAYVRTRKGVGDSDFSRARRQQQLLLALRQEITTSNTLLRIPELTRAIGQTIDTNFPAGRVGEFIDIALGIDTGNVVQKVLGPPFAVRATGPNVFDYRLRLDMARLAALSIELFGDDSRYAEAAPP
ncbi:MAG: LCP family protein [Candidatus Limnocylindria bacterium]